jgi:hypothetical protein
MDWIVPISAQERESGKLSPETQRAAQEAFHKTGCVVLRGMYATSTLDAMYQDYVDRYGALDSRAMHQETLKPLPNPFIERDNARYEITPRMNGALGAREIYANGMLRQFLAPVLGIDMRLHGYTVIVSHPAASLQRIHRDHAFLFTEPGVSQNLPTYAINIAVPLTDIEVDMGPTGFWPGSHRWPRDQKPLAETITAVALQRGDCQLLDYRTLHAGLPNKTMRVRPIIYMIFSRSWFFDDVNHIGRPSLDMTLEEYEQLPLTDRPLLTRAFSEATRARAEDVRRAAAEPAPPAARNPRDPSAWGKVGRNDPCPCGSGKKYKQCHGRAA